MATELDGSNYSEVDASNNNAAPNGMPEGMPPSGVNDAWRQGMGAIKRAFDRDHAGSWCTVGGTGNAVTLAYTTGPVSYIQGQKFTFLATAANTGATTVNVSGLGAKNVFKKSPGGGPVACTGGEIQNGDIVELEYDGTQFQLISGQAVALTPATWTPADVSGAALVLTSVSGKYTQIGNMVFAYATFTYPATADATAAKISLPVAAGTPYGTISHLTGVANTACRTLSGTSTADFRAVSTGGVLTNTNVAGSTYVVNLVYPAS